MNTTTQPDLTAELYEALSDLVDRIERTLAPRVDRHGHGPWQMMPEGGGACRMCTRCGEVQAMRAASKRDCEGKFPLRWEQKLRGDGSCGSAPYKVSGGGR